MGEKGEKERYPARIEKTASIKKRRIAQGTPDSNPKKRGKTRGSLRKEKKAPASPPVIREEKRRKKGKKAPSSQRFATGGRGEKTHSKIHIRLRKKKKRGKSRTLGRLKKPRGQGH